MDEVQELQPNHADLPRKGKRMTFPPAKVYLDHLYLLTLQPANWRLHSLPDLPGSERQV